MADGRRPPPPLPTPEKPQSGGRPRLGELYLHVYNYWTLNIMDQNNIINFVFCKIQTGKSRLNSKGFQVHHQVMKVKFGILNLNF